MATFHLLEHQCLPTVRVSVDKPSPNPMLPSGGSGVCMEKDCSWDLWHHYRKCHGDISSWKMQPSKDVKVETGPLGPHFLKPSVSTDHNKQ